MKAKIIRDYPNREVKKEMIDVEYSLFERGTSIKKLNAGAAGLFISLKAHDNEIVDIYKLSNDSKRSTTIAFKKLQEIGLIKTTDIIENNEKLKVIYLQNPDEVL